MSNLAIADVDDLIVGIDSDDLLAALQFFCSTVSGFGTEDVAAFLRDLQGNPVTDDDVHAMAERFRRVINALTV